VKDRFLRLAGTACVFAAIGTAQAAEPTSLTIFAAGTLAVPFRQLDREFEQQHAGTTVQPYFGGSVMMAKRITNLHQPADLIAVADYNVIPKYLFGRPMPHGTSALPATP
jgi:molybdate/tungstate transport system substrate-binding protein